MTVRNTIYAVLLTILFGCNTNSSPMGLPRWQQKPGEILRGDPSASADTIKKLVVDDFPVPDDLLGRDANGREIRSGDTRSLDKAWFTNKSLNQTLVFELYTDYHRLATFLLVNNDIPKEMMERMELHDEKGEVVSYEQKKQDFRGLIDKAGTIDAAYFTSVKGFRVGTTSQKALDIYGRPGKVSRREGYEMWEWDFAGEAFYEGEDLKGKPLAKDSYGHQLTMFFRGGMLIGLIFHNDIP